MPGYRPGTSWGSIYNPAKSPWTYQGSNGQFQDMTAVIEPDNPYDNILKGAQAESLRQQTEAGKQKLSILQGFLSGFKPGGMGSMSLSSNFPSLPGPNYLTPQPVYSQSQVDSMSGLQRSALLGQAANNTRRFTSSLASRGFSPLSTLGSFMEQNNLMKANAGAAQAETQLNFDAAKANSDARIQTEGLNTSRYGSYIDALGRQRSIDADIALKQLGMQYDLYNSILRGVL